MTTFVSITSRLYFWLCFAWLLFGQGLMVTALWFADEDVPTLFGSPRLLDVYCCLENTFERSFLTLQLVLPACAVLLLMAIMLSRRRYKPEQVRFGMTWVVGGLVCNALLYESILAVDATMPDRCWGYYGPPPSVVQLAVALGMVALSLVVLVCTMRRARRYRLGRTGQQA